MLPIPSRLNFVPRLGANINLSSTVKCMLIKVGFVRVADLDAA
jgi:hypothetical protein